MLVMYSLLLVHLYCLTVVYLRYEYKVKLFKYTTTESVILQRIFNLNNKLSILTLFQVCIQKTKLVAYKTRFYHMKHCS
jgi:hypothetical protein